MTAFGKTLNAEVDLDQFEGMTSDFRVLLDSDHKMLSELIGDFCLMQRKQLELQHNKMQELLEQRFSCFMKVFRALDPEGYQISRSPCRSRCTWNEAWHESSAQSSMLDVTCEVAPGDLPALPTTTDETISREEAKKRTPRMEVGVNKKLTRNSSESQRNNGKSDRNSKYLKKMQMELQYKNMTKSPRINSFAKVQISAPPRRFSDIVTSTPFNCVIATAIVANAIVIGTTADYEVKAALNGTGDSDMIRFLTAVDIVFTVLFALELLARLVALKFSFLDSQDWFWNLLDVVIVLSSIAELVLAGSGLDLKYIRLLRLARVMRTLRLAVIVPVFGKVRTMINAFTSSVSSLLGAVGLILFILFIFAIIFMQATIQHVGEASDQDLHVLKTFFGSLDLTLLTLFMCVTSGIGWWDVERVLLNVHLLYGALFVCYISLMVISLLNIVTGICVNGAMEMAQHDRDLMLQVEMDRRTSHMGELQRVFKALDSDGSGKVNFQQFSNFIQLPDVAALFSVLGLDVSDPRAFFQALDIDSSAELEEDEFVMGCMQYQGNAKATDMVFLLRDTQSVLREIRQNMQRTSEQLLRMEHVLYSGPVTNSTTTEAASSDTQVAIDDI